MKWSYRWNEWWLGIYLMGSVSGWRGKRWSGKRQNAASKNLDFYALLGHVKNAAVN